MISIRKYRGSDAEQAAQVVRDTFRKFNKHEGTREAMRAYAEHYNWKENSLKILESFNRSQIFYVAEDTGKIAGIVRGSKDRVVNLFVLGSYHSSGLGRRLMERFESESVRNGSREIRVRASLYAVPFYEHLGYKKTTGVRNFTRINGLKYQPMRKNLR